MTTIRQPSTHEAGFSLAELLVTIAILGLILAAVLGVYQMAQRATLVATAAEDAQVVTRVTLERIVTDLQLINAGRPAAAGAILTATATSLTFLGDVDNDTADPLGNPATLIANPNATTVQVSSAQGFSVGERFSVQSWATSETQLIAAIAGTTLTLAAPGLSASYPPGSLVRSVETVTYAWDPATGALCRNVGGPCVVPFPNNLVIATLMTNPPGFQLTYWNGLMQSGQTAILDQIREIRVTITANAQMGDQTVRRTMTTTVRPRNL